MPSSRTIPRVFPDEPPRPRPGGRSREVVANVLRTAAVELARTGYEAFRVDDVAVAAGVNKTTIYRRWPTKSALVAAVMRHLYDSLADLPDTGVLREDFVRGLAMKATHPELQGIARIALTQVDQPDIAAMAQELRKESRARWVVVVKRAIARGELRRDVDARLLVEVITSTVFGRLSRGQEPVTAQFCAEVVDLVLAGARPVAASKVPPRKAPARRSR